MPPDLIYLGAAAPFVGEAKLSALASIGRSNKTSSHAGPFCGSINKFKSGLSVTGITENMIFAKGKCRRLFQ
jgi:hypothetical protein